MMKMIFRIGLVLSFVVSLLLTSCVESKKEKARSKMTTEELKEEYGAECVELSREASLLFAKRWEIGKVGQNVAEIQKEKEDTIRKAILLLDEAIKENPKYPYAYKLKSECYAVLKDYSKAIECLKQCEQLLPKEEQGTNYFTQALLEYKRGQKEEMQRLCKASLKINNEILEQNPYDLEAIGEKAYLLSILGLKDKAQKFLDSYRDNPKVDQKSLDFFCEAIKTKHLLNQLSRELE